MELKRPTGKVHALASGDNTVNMTNAASPSLYRSEAFVEDLDLMTEPFDAESEGGSKTVQRFAAWLLAVPGTVAVLASAVVIATLPN
jgi:hypothetical protein